MQTPRAAIVIGLFISTWLCGCGGSDRKPESERPSDGAEASSGGRAGNGGQPSDGNEASSGGRANGGQPSDGAEASSGGRASNGGGASSLPLEVVQVETVTTVQSSAGLFLSPAPARDVPAYVERSTEAPSALSAEQQELAKVEIALLFRAPSTSATEELTARVVSPTAAPWSAIQHYFPHLEQTVSEVYWPLRVSGVERSDLADTVSPEWRGWQDYRGLGVHGALEDGRQAPVATLEFDTLGRESPLVLSAEGESLMVTNRSDHAVERALLIYSHPGGVGVTAVPTVGPGQRALTVLGPKEHPPDALLTLAREQLTNFFAASVGPELGSAMAAAKSIPFLETEGLRLIALIAQEEEPASVSFSAPVSAQKHVVVSHSEILKPEEEARVLSAVMSPSFTAEQAVETLGRFTEAKLEFAARSSDPAVSARSIDLLSELRNR